MLGTFSFDVDCSCGSSSSSSNTFRYSRFFGFYTMPFNGFALLLWKDSDFFYLLRLLKDVLRLALSTIFAFDRWLWAGDKDVSLLFLLWLSSIDGWSKGRIYVFIRYSAECKLEDWKRNGFDFCIFWIGGTLVGNWWPFSAIPSRMISLLISFANINTKYWVFICGLPPKRTEK